MALEVIPDPLKNALNTEYLGDPHGKEAGNKKHNSCAISEMPEKKGERGILVNAQEGVPDAVVKINRCFTSPRRIRDLMPDFR